MGKKEYLEEVINSSRVFDLIDDPLFALYNYIAKNVGHSIDNKIVRGIEGKVEDIVRVKVGWKIKQSVSVSH